MKILHVIPSMDPQRGGMCQAVRTLVARLLERQVCNEVVSLDDPDAFFVRGESFRVHALGRGKGAWYSNTRLVPWLLDNLCLFDVVIVHGLWAYPGYAVRKVMKNLVKKSAADRLPKLFVMPHGMLDPYFQRAPGRRLKALRNIVYWKLIEGQTVNNSDGLLFTCSEELRLAREPFKPYHPVRQFVTGLGAEPAPAYSPAMQEAFLQTCPGLVDGPYLLFLSRIHEKKGVEMLLNAYAEAVKASEQKRPQPVTAGAYEEEFTYLWKTTRPFPRLVIAGPGLDTPYGQAMQQMVKQNEDLRHSVFFTGMLTGAAKWGAFYGCEAFILPSHQENFGIAVTEALSCGRPVLISDQVNIWQEIARGGAGYVAGDTQTGTKSLLERWNDTPDDLRFHMATNALHTFARHFSAAAAANRILQSIQDACR